MPRAHMDAGIELKIGFGDVKPLGGAAPAVVPAV
jgi:hypothetical protein